MARPAGDRDFELLEAWRQGDAAAGRALVERQFKLLYRFFRTKVALGDVDELIQTTLLRCIERRDAWTYQGAKFSTYVFAVGRSVLLAHYRERHRLGAFDPSVSSVADAAPSPSSAMVRRERDQILLQALRSLAFDHQLLLELHYWERLPGSELAAVLELPEGTVRTRLRRAKALLREALVAAAEDPAASYSEQDLDQWAQSLRQSLE